MAAGPAQPPMRILNIISTLDPSGGGPIEGSIRLSELWREQGHVADFATLDSPDAPFLKGIESNVTPLGRLGAPGSAQGPTRFTERFGYTPAIVPWLRGNVARYDAVVVHGLWNYSTLAARRVLPGGKTPYFVFPHGALDPWFGKADPRKHAAKHLLWPLSEGVLMNNATAVLFTTEDERQLANGCHWPWRVRSAVVGFGSSDVEGDAEQQIAAFRAAVPALGERPFLLFLSRIHPKKGCDLLIEGFARLAAAHPELDLVMAGPDEKGWRIELEARCRALGIAERVHWTGMIKGDLKWGAFRACEAFALTSHTENFGIVVAEALACGTPVLITDKVNLWREVAACDAGMIETDTQEGVDRLLARFLALDSEEKAALSGRARICFERHFRMETAAARILDVMRNRVGIT
jgi:glycosyltransferase involved in cell wall biosynthesis